MSEPAGPDADGEPVDDADGSALPGARARAVLEYLVGAVVEEPDGVEVVVDDRGRQVSLEVSVAPGDMGRVIGKRGRVANAIRTVVRAAAVRDGVDVAVDFVD